MFRWIERSGALELELESESEEGVFIDALEGLRELLEEDAGAGLGAEAQYEVDASGEDRATLLAGWLRRLSALAEHDGFVPHRITSLDLRADGVTATVEGACGPPPRLLCDVTDDGLVYEIAPDSHRVHAAVTLSVQDAAGA